MDILSLKRKSLGHVLREGESESSESSPSQTSVASQKDSDSSPTAASDSGVFGGKTAGFSSDNSKPGESAQSQAAASVDASLQPGQAPASPVAPEGGSNWGKVADAAAFLGMFTPATAPLSAAYYAAKPVVGLASDLSDGGSIGDSISKFAKGIIGSHIAGAINGAVGQAVGPGAANALSAYSKVATADNLMNDTNNPASVGGLVANAAMHGNPDASGAPSEGSQFASSPSHSYGGFSAGPPPAQQVASNTAQPQPVQAATPSPNGIIGNYLDWYQQGHKQGA